MRVHRAPGAPLVVWVVLSGGSVLAITSLLYVVALFATAFRAPAIILLERRLDYQPMLVVDVVEVIVYNAVAVTAVVLGAGPVALAVATIIKGTTGTTLLLRKVRAARVIPRVDISVLRPVLDFGLKSQGVQAVTLARDQVLNYGTAAIAGLSVLGIWTLASKIMLLPALVFESLWRISFPTFARLMDAGEDLAPIVTRSIAIMAVATPMSLVPVVAGAPALPALLGDEWRDAVSVLPFLCFATALVVPMSTVTTGFLFARGDAGVVLRIVVLLSITFIGVGFALLPFIGVIGLGVGFAAAGIVDAGLHARAIRQRIDADVLRGLWPPLVYGGVAAALGRLAGAAASGDLAGGLVGAGVALLLYLAFAA